jgi:Zn-dependent peptidase ImmA (M78 family)
MQTRKDLARKALAAALEIRKNNVKNLVEPICIYDLAEQLEIEVRFADIPSLEGMYSSTPRPAIIIGSERPSGRRVYTCAHELGHHVFGHGTRVDELRPDGVEPPNFEPEEFLAQAFSGFLLMPKLALCNAFSNRGWKPAHATAEQIYRVSNYFGVTYAAFIHHLSVLSLLPALNKAHLLNIKPKDIRAAFIPDPKRQLVIVDAFWKGRAIDLEVGDIVLTPIEAVSEGSCLTKIGQTQQGGLFEAVQPGRGRLVYSAANWAGFVRVSRHFYVGRSIYRHFEEEANE